VPASHCQWRSANFPEKREGLPANIAKPPELAEAGSSGEVNFPGF
jgi:hypothetical protein